MVLAAAPSRLGRSFMPIASPCALPCEAADAAAARRPAHPAPAQPPPRVHWFLSLSCAAASVKRGGRAASPPDDRTAGAESLSLPRLLPRRRTDPGAAAALPGLRLAAAGA